jgi:uncharacterized linocin/CFP29 family protein
MKPLRFVGKDDYISTEQGEYLTPSAIRTVRRAFVGRKLIPVENVPAETQVYVYDVISEMSGARIDPTYPGREVLDVPLKTRSKANINNIHHEFEIRKADLDAARMSGEPLSTTASDLAAYQVGWLLDKYIILGTTIEGTKINGLYAAAANSEATSLDWTTVANIITSINNAIALMVADHMYRPYNLLINATQEADLSQLVGSGPSAYRNWVEQRIGGAIYTSEGITAGTGLLLKADPVDMYKLVIAEDITVKTEQENLRAGEGLFGKVYTRCVPVVPQPNALCKLTTI